MVVRAIEAQLKDKTYDERLTPTWVNFILEDVMAGLVALKKPFKYAVHVVVVQNTGAGVHVATSEWCDDVSDGSAVVKWPTDRTKDTGNCAAIVTIFAAAFFV